MSHALIIDDNMAISRGIERRLHGLGFNSFDHSCSGRQAVEAARQHRPDLIVIGTSIADGSPVKVAEILARSCDVPVLAVTQDRCSLQRALPSGACLEGPFMLADLDCAIAAAVA